MAPRVPVDAPREYSELLVEVENHPGRLAELARCADATETEIVDIRILHEDPMKVSISVVGDTEGLLQDLLSHGWRVP